jgi:hypothetical protein
MNVSQAEHMLKKVQEIVGGEYWESMRGVPVLTIGVYNISYFQKRHSFRLFIHNEGGKIDCKTYLDVIYHIQRRRR